MPVDLKSSLKNSLQEDAKDSLRSGEKLRLSVLRMALAAIQQREVDSRKDLDNIEVQTILEKMVKQRHEAAGLFIKGSRKDLAEKEKAEIEFLSAYLPAPLTEEETTALIEEVIASLKADSPSDMGRVMGEIKQRSQGQVDLRKASSIVRTRLSNT